MRELAESLKKTPGVRIRQAVVTAVDEPTITIQVAGSTVEISDVYHLDSCAPAVGDVVWIASDGADLWILGTCGVPYFRTGTGGGRVEIGADPLEPEMSRSVRFYTGSANENPLYPALVGSAYIDDDNVSIGIRGAALGVTIPSVTLYTHKTLTPHSWINIVGDDVRVNGLSIANPPYAALFRTTNQTIANATTTNIFFGTGGAEADTDGMFDPGVNDRLTVQHAGVYVLDAAAAFAGNSTGYRYLELVAGGNVVGRDYKDGLTTGLCYLHTTATVALAVGDLIVARVRQTSTVTLAVSSLPRYSPRLSAAWIRPPA